MVVIVNDDALAVVRESAREMAKGMPPAMGDFFAQIAEDAITNYITALQAREDALKERLVQHCREFIAEHRITVPETIYQMDRVIVAAPEFIEGICDIVGYAKREEEE